MIVKITKLEKYHKEQISVMDVGDSVIGEIGSWTDILPNNPIILQNAYYEKLPKKVYEMVLLVNKVIDITGHESFKTDFASYKIEEL